MSRVPWSVTFYKSVDLRTLRVSMWLWRASWVSLFIVYVTFLYVIFQDFLYLVLSYMWLWKIYDQFKELCSQGSNMANESYKNVLPSSGVIQCITIRFFTFAWKCFCKSALQGWYLCEFMSISDDPFPGPGIQRENTVTLTFDNFVTFCNFFFWNHCSVYSGVFVYL